MILIQIFLIVVIIIYVIGIIGFLSIIFGAFTDIIKDIGEVLGKGNK